MILFYKVTYGTVYYAIVVQYKRRYRYNEGEKRLVSLWRVSGQGAGDRVLPLFSLHSLWRVHDQVRLKFFKMGGGGGAWVPCAGRAT